MSLSAIFSAVSFSASMSKPQLIMEAAEFQVNLAKAIGQTSIAMASSSTPQSQMNTIKKAFKELNKITKNVNKTLSKVHKNKMNINMASAQLDDNAREATQATRVVDFDALGFGI